MIFENIFDTHPTLVYTMCKCKCLSHLHVQTFYTYCRMFLQLHKVHVNVLGQASVYIIYPLF
jgi:hypothetical protein